MIRAIRERILRFLELGKKGKTWFDFKPYCEIEFESSTASELVFCISAANSSAISALKLQQKIYEKGIDMKDEKWIMELMKECGVRFYRRKTKYVISALERLEEIEGIIGTYDPVLAREWLVLNVKGLGYKEASHFLRNTGKFDVAIIDRHTLRWMEKENYIPSFIKPVNPSRRRDYFLLEKLLAGIAHYQNMSVGELDLLIWWHATKKVLK